jgi:carboxypeptidase Q
MKRVAFAVACAAACGPSYTYGPGTPAWVSDTQSFMPAAAAAPSVAEEYRGVAQKLIAAARSDRDAGAYAKLAELTDTIGHRLSGSAALDKAIAWAAQRMKDDGLEVRTEPVIVPVWQRGAESAAITSPVARPLHVLGLGNTVATPKGGITGPVVVVHDWKELESRADQIKGAIVLYDSPMATWSAEHGSGYGTAVTYRSAGASKAAKLGALAVLVRSITATSLSTPHTGAVNYDKDQPKIPAAAVTVEDAELLDRLTRKGTVQVRLQLEAQTLPDAPSANVIGELRGSDKPDEIVVLAAHIDSWDVGQGAHDDGAGCVAMMQALATIKRLGLQPRRTIRVVLFTNEENGLRGGKTYAEAHAAELPKTVFALESDSGGYRPTGFAVDHVDPEAARRSRARLAPIAALLGDVGATSIEEGGGGADIRPMKPAGVPQVGLELANRTYFDYHHTHADTLDKVAPHDLAEMVAAIAVVAYVVADLPERIDAPISAQRAAATVAPAPTP